MFTVGVIGVVSVQRRLCKSHGLSAESKFPRKSMKVQVINNSHSSLRELARHASCWQSLCPEAPVASLMKRMWVRVVIAVRLHHVVCFPSLISCLQGL